MKKILLVDGYSVLFRAYYSTLHSSARSDGKMQTQNGIPTNAVFGFIRILNKYIEQLNPDALLVAFDAGGKVFRHEMMEEYKGTRKELDEDLLAQMPIVREYLDQAGIMRYEQKNYEADDIIGTVAKNAADMQTYILTGDQDLMQLVSERVTVLRMLNGQMAEAYDPQKVLEKYGVHPDQIADLKGLQGDSSDNIPGVKGIGPKTAAKLLNEYHDIENIYAHIDDLKGAQKKKLETGKESAFLSKELATIECGVKVDFGFEDMAVPTDDANKRDFFEKYEMSSLLSTLSTAPAIKTRPLSQVTALDATFGYGPAFMLPLADEAPFMEARLYGFFMINANAFEYIDLEQAKKDPSFAQMLKNKELSVWNAKRTWHLLDRNGLDLPDFKNDLHLACFLLHSQATSTEAMINALQIQLPVHLKDLEKKSLGGFTKERAMPVFTAWADQAFEVIDPLMKQIEQEELEHLYRDIELPLSRILYEMEKEGIRINLDVLDGIGKSYEAIMTELEKKIFDLAGHSFNIGSPKQLAGVLYDELKLKSPSKRSTAAEVLEKLQKDHPIVGLILEYRKYAKIVTTYVDGLNKAAIDGKIHTTFNQTIAQTGRLSSSDPNLQNISIKTEEGKEIRKAFIPSENSYLLSADYSQIELRMLAHMANEEYMIQAFMDGVDIHNRTACLIFDVPEDEVDASQRRIAKTVNFAIIYGQTEFGLSTELHISRSQAQQFIQAYLASYPRVSEYMDELIDFCKEHGYVKTLLNRRRAIPEIRDKNFMIRERGKRAAMNAPIQGSAADLIKVAMIDVAKAIKEKNLRSKMLLQIHDELIFDVPEDELEIMKELVRETMDHAMNLTVPLEADVHYGKNWYEAK